MAQTKVSTHSRAEAAAFGRGFCRPQCYRFNTQPRGGGCWGAQRAKNRYVMFQHTAARRRLQTL